MSDDVLDSLLQRSDIVMDSSIENNDREVYKSIVYNLLTRSERMKMLDILKGVAKRALGDNHEISDGTLNQLLLEDKNVLEATKAYKVGKENDDKAAEMAAGHNLLMLLGKARWDLADDDI